MESINITAVEAEQLISDINTKLEFSTLRQKIVKLHDENGWQVLGFKSFKACVKERCSLGKSHIYRELDAATVEKNIGVPLGGIAERQLRPLAKLTPEQQKQVWESVSEDKRTGKTIAEAKEALFPSGKPAKEDHKARIQELEEQLSEKDAEIARLNALLSSCAAPTAPLPTVEPIKAKLVEREEEIMRLEDKMQVLQLDNASLQSDNDNMKEEIQHLEAQLASLQRKAATPITTLQKPQNTPQKAIQPKPALSPVSTSNLPIEDEDYQPEDEYLTPGETLKFLLEMHLSNRTTITFLESRKIPFKGEKEKFCIPAYATDIIREGFANPKRY